MTLVPSKRAGETDGEHTVRKAVAQVSTLNSRSQFAKVAKSGFKLLSYVHMFLLLLKPMT